MQHKGTKELETERLILRSWQPEDLNDLYEYAKNPDVGSMAGWEPHSSKAVSLAVLKSFIEVSGNWAIVLKETRKAIGQLRIYPDVNRGKYNAKYINFALSFDYWGKGYMTEAIKRIVEYVFKDMGIDLLSVFHYPHNIRSKRVIEKCGFTYEATLKQSQKIYNGQIYDSVCYYMMNPDINDDKGVFIMNGITFRRLEPGDIDRLVELRKMQLREEGAKETCDITGSLLDFYKRHFKDGTFVSWIAANGDEIIATSGMSFTEKPPYYRNPTGRIGILSSMYTLPEYRRRGIAKKLLGLVVNEAKEYGCGIIHLTASDSGVPLYENFGFERNSNFFEYRL